MAATRRPDSPYRRIVAQIRERIDSGELRPGERVPSIREIAQRWGVANATATRVTATLREAGLVETRVGAGTVVSRRAAATKTPMGTPTGTPMSKEQAEQTDHFERSEQQAERSEQQADQSEQQADQMARTDQTEHTPQTAPTDQTGQTLSHEQLVRIAIQIADTEGLDAVSMRRLAAQLGVGPMSLYRHVANKDELLLQMADMVLAELALPESGPDGWRAKLELVARHQWQLCRAHFWLPRVISFTRPLLVPNMMAYTEWTLRALEGLDLSPAIKLQETLTLHTFVVTIGLVLADEVEAEQNTGVSLERWTADRQARVRELLDSGRFPLLAAVPGEGAPILEELFEYGLARHLDGFAALLEHPDGRVRTEASDR